MPEEKKDQAAVSDLASSTPETTNDENIIRVKGGKEFDISTEQGRRDLKLWHDAIVTTVGTQGQELGELRKFKAEMSPASDEADLLKRVSELRKEDEHEKADELILAHTRQRERALLELQENKQENAKLWAEYFSKRPKVLQHFDEDYVKEYSSKRVDLTAVEDPFKTLDALWTPRLSKFGPASGGSETSPTSIPGGGSPRPATTPQSSKKDSERFDFNKVCEDAYVYRKR